MIPTSSARPPREHASAATSALSASVPEPTSATEPSDSRNAEARARRVSRFTTTRTAGRRDTPSTGSSRTHQEAAGTRYGSVELAIASRQAYARPVALPRRYRPGLLDRVRGGGGRAAGAPADRSACRAVDAGRSPLGATDRRRPSAGGTALRGHTGSRPRYRGRLLPLEHGPLPVAELGAAFLGGTTLASLAGAGLVEELRAGALSRATTAFRADREPFYLGGWAFPAY